MRYKMYIYISVCKMFTNSYVLIVKMNHDGALLSDRKLMMSMIKHWKYSHRGIWRQHNLRISVVSNIIKQKLWIISNHYKIWKCFVTLFYMPNLYWFWPIKWYSYFSMQKWYDEENDIFNIMRRFSTHCF